MIARRPRRPRLVTPLSGLTVAVMLAAGVAALALERAGPMVAVVALGMTLGLGGLVLGTRRREPPPPPAGVAVDRLAGALAGAVGAVIGVDEEGRILLFNEVAERYFDYSAPEVLGQRLDHLVPISATRLALAAPGERLEVTAWRRDGAARTAEVSLARLEQAGQTLILVIVRDLTPYKTALAALAQSRQEFQSLVEHLPDPVARFDRAHRSTYVNPAMQQAIGLDLAAAVGRTPEELGLPAAPAGGWPEQLERVVATGRPVAFTGALPAADEPRRWRVQLLPEAGPGGASVLAVARDITDEARTEATLREARERLEEWVRERAASLEESNERLQNELTERRRAEETLRASQRFIDRITAAVPSLIYVYDLIDSRNVYASRELAGLLGYASSAVEPVSPSLLERLMHPADLPVFRSHLTGLGTLADGELLTVEFRLRHADDSWHWLRGREGVFTRADDGQPWLILGMVEDVTEEKWTEAALRRANDELRDSVADLERRTREVALLRRMGELLHACREVAEAYAVVVAAIQELFPGGSGLLAVLDEAGDLLTVVADWGDQVPARTAFAPDACWALRRNAMHVVRGPGAAARCRHLATLPAGPYLCLPLIAHEATLGMLHLRPAAGGDGLTESRRELAATVAGQVALALANLRLRETLQTQSTHDPLTGLYNRRYLEEALEREVRRAGHEQSALALLLIDIDYFKRVNDTYGHDAGDLVLRELSAFLRSAIRDDDVACRYGGEEFLLLLPRTSLEAALRRARQLCEQSPLLLVRYGGQALGPITLSIGVACFPEHGPHGAALIQAADAALYRAKAEGRDRVVCAPIGAAGLALH